MKNNNYTDPTQIFIQEGFNIPMFRKNKNLMGENEPLPADIKDVTPTTDDHIKAGVQKLKEAYNSGFDAIEADPELAAVKVIIIKEFTKAFVAHNKDLVLEALKHLNSGE